MRTAQEIDDYINAPPYAAARAFLAKNFANGGPVGRDSGLATSDGKTGGNAGGPPPTSGRDSSLPTSDGKTGGNAGGNVAPSRPPASMPGGRGGNIAPQRDWNVSPSNRDNNSSPMPMGRSGNPAPARQNTAPAPAGRGGFPERASPAPAWQPPTGDSGRAGLSKLAAYTPEPRDRSPANGRLSGNRIDEYDVPLARMAADPKFYLGMRYPELYKMRDPSPGGVKGLLGNLKQESGFDPAALGGGGDTGLAQWTNSGNRLNRMLNAIGVDPALKGPARLEALRGTGPAQLGHIYSEALTTPMYRPTLDALTDPNINAASAAAAIMRNYERPNPRYANLPRRIANANAAEIPDAPIPNYGRAGLSAAPAAAPAVPDPAATKLIERRNYGTRNRDITPELDEQIQRGVARVYGPGYKFVMTSGGQPREGEILPNGKRATKYGRNPTREGSPRHDDHGHGGMAADGHIVEVATGKTVSGVPLAQLWRARDIGGTGLEMAGRNVHFDQHTDRARTWAYTEGQGGRFTPQMAEALRAGTIGDYPKMYDPYYGGMPTVAGATQGIMRDRIANPNAVVIRPRTLGADPVTVAPRGKVPAGAVQKAAPVVPPATTPDEAPAGAPVDIAEAPPKEKFSSTIPGRVGAGIVNVLGGAVGGPLVTALQLGSYGTTGQSLGAHAVDWLAENASGELPVQYGGETDYAAAPQGGALSTYANKTTKTRKPAAAVEAQADRRYVGPVKDPTRYGEAGQRLYYAKDGGAVRVYR